MILMVLERQARTSEQLAWIRGVLEEHEGPLLQYAQALLGDEARARDVVQDSFVRLLEQPRGDVAGREGPWLFRVCRNRALDVLRKEARVKPVDAALTTTPSPAPTPLALAEGNELPYRIEELVRGSLGEDRAGSRKELLQLVQTARALSR